MSAFPSTKEGFGLAAGCSWAAAAHAHLALYRRLAAASAR
ncbi:hypothetical protein FraQA3DRAFT_5649 [Frankia sp. QA3]|nr:hypothetical protein FraQA3DRAFT_5649 [Frankia sp. QA3]